ncbi:MAG: hypothetical protein WC554_09805 [Clostridia bacterium]
MKRYHVSPNNWATVWIDEAEPECGKDFCDTCGDCLHCYGGDPCLHWKEGDEDWGHQWVVYEPKGTLPGDKEADQ